MRPAGLRLEVRGRCFSDSRIYSVALAPGAEAMCTHTHARTHTRSLCPPLPLSLSLCNKELVFPRRGARAGNFLSRLQVTIPPSPGPGAPPGRPSFNPASWVTQGACWLRWRSKGKTFVVNQLKEAVRNGEIKPSRRFISQGLCPN